MPTYEYECEACGAFDLRQGINDPKLETCPNEACGAPCRRKIGRGSGVIFKGTGFYETDYKRTPPATSRKE